MARHVSRALAHYLSCHGTLFILPRIFIPCILSFPASNRMNTIYAGETYRLRIQFPADYPTSPPSVYFLPPTPRHEHVYTNGDICLSLLGSDWRPIMTAQSVAQAIMSILCGAHRKSLPMDNARHAGNKPGKKQDDWVYHDDNC
jgi:ubiquitin-conjugating enzyme E2 W